MDLLGFSLWINVKINVEIGKKNMTGTRGHGLLTQRTRAVQLSPFSLISRGLGVDHGRGYSYTVLPHIGLCFCSGLRKIFFI